MGKPAKADKLKNPAPLKAWQHSECREIDESIIHYKEMKIFRTSPQESKQWQSDAPGIKAMRLILPVTAILSAVSLAGGIASFFKVGLTTTIGICLVVAFAVGAWFFDHLAIISGQSVVRDLILGWKGEMEKNIMYWISLATAAGICGVMVWGSFTMSKNGIAYLVLEVRKAKEVATQIDTTLSQTTTGAIDRNAGTLEAIRTANEAQQAAINATYAGKVEALEAEIERRKKQRTSENYQYIDNKVAKLKAQIGEVKAEQGQKLAELATSFAAEQKQLLAKSDTLQSVIVADAVAASERQKQLQQEKDQRDKELSDLISGIFAWSVVLMLVIGLRLTMLETRNDILPNPVLSNADLSGSMMPIRFLMTIPNFIFSCLHWVSEWLYNFAPKHRTPVVDNDVVDFKAAQMEVAAIRKEGKVRKLAAAERREIGFKPSEKVGSENLGSGEKVGSEKVGSSAKKLANKGGNFSDPEKSGSEKVGSTDDGDMSDAKRDLIQQVKMSKKELTKYKKRQASSYQKIEAAKAAGEQPKMQQLKAYENRTAKVQELTAQVQQLEARLNNLS